MYYSCDKLGLRLCHKICRRPLGMWFSEINLWLEHHLDLRYHLYDFHPSYLQVILKKTGTTRLFIKKHYASFYFCFFAVAFLIIGGRIKIGKTPKVKIANIAPPIARTATPKPFINPSENFFPLSMP